MIAVIADDLTGAAEIAGIGWRHGLKGEILHRDELPTNADLVVYDSDSRNCSPAEARRRLARLTRRLQQQRPDWIFKKVDSVLRGNVLAEIQSAMTVLGLNRCLLVPANPAAGRVIRNGRYFIHGKPIHRTDFRLDPRHPRRAADITKLLGTPRDFAVAVLSARSTAIPDGIVVGEAATVGDVRRWSRKVDEHTLAAGAAEFFLALVRRHASGPRAVTNKLRTPAAHTLFVCGSVAASAAEFLKRSRADGWPVLLMPDELLRGGRRAGNYQRTWRRQIVEALERHLKVIVGIGPSVVAGRRRQLGIGRKLTNAVALILAGSQPDCVCVEGGATAAMLMQRMGWTRLSVEHEFSAGVVGTRPQQHPGLLFVCKPGSYRWPAALAR